MKKIRKVFEEELIGGEYYSFEVVVWYEEIEDSGTEYALPSSEVEVEIVDLFRLYAYDREIVESDWDIVENWIKDNFVQRFF
jgi:hypothetical protein